MGKRTRRPRGRGGSKWIRWGRWMVADFSRPVALRAVAISFFFFQNGAGSQKFPCGGIRWRWAPQMMNSFNNSFFGTKFEFSDYSFSGTEGLCPVRLVPTAGLQPQPTATATSAPRQLSPAHSTPALHPSACSLSPQPHQRHVSFSIPDLTISERVAL